jgi:dGTPase
MTNEPDQLAVEGVRAVAERQIEIVRQTIEDVLKLLSDLAQPASTEDRRTKTLEPPKSSRQIDEIAEKIPSATAELKQALKTACAILEQRSCTIRELLEKKPAGVSTNDITDAVAALMLAGKATYTGDRSKTVMKANRELERFILDSLHTKKQSIAVDDLEKVAEREGISLDDLRDALMTESVSKRVELRDGRIYSVFQRPPAKAERDDIPKPGTGWERYYEEAAPTTYGFENQYVKDHERIVYSSEFRRLAGVTQVFGTSEGHVFHNRLTHSIKAAQIARSIAMRPALQGRVDPDVVEAATLAHDLGHPPFGHAGEAELDRLLTDVHRVEDGYEGNAQNLRIVTQLSRVRREFRGLNLTRATLNALMKYPWSRGTGKKAKKWNTYSSESRFFQFARSQMTGEGAEKKSDEAQVMEWADDIAYGVHDIEDGVRAGMIPLSELLNDSGERERFLEGSRGWWEDQPGFNKDKNLAKAASNILLLAESDLWRPYDDDAAQQAALRQLTTVLHHRYILAVKCDEKNNELRLGPEGPEYEMELTMLKCLMRFYVFSNPVLLPQQYGQRRIISDLFRYFFEATQSNRTASVLPTRVRELFDEDDSPNRGARAAADTIAGMTELEAVAMHRVVTGTDPGRIRGRIIS